jgi:hypothetical protein
MLGKSIAFCFVCLAIVSAAIVARSGGGSPAPAKSRQYGIQPAATDPLPWPYHGVTGTQHLSPKDFDPSGNPHLYWWGM